jgi:DNA transposition AAA+ family ATPase
MSTKVVEQLKNFLETHQEFTQTRVAASIGVSVSALNSWMKYTYKGDNAKLEKAVAYFLEAQKEAGAETGRFKKDFDFVETDVYRDVLRSVNLAEYRGEIRPIVGISGVGKTVAIEHIKEDKGSSMILVRCYPGMRKIRLMKKLAIEAGTEGAGTYDDLFEDICSRLKNTGRVIAFDEAEHMSIETIDAARRINDFTGCGVVFIGLPKFYNELSSRQRDYAYVYNRTSLPMKLKKNSADDLSLMASTMISASIPAKVYENACNGVGRDLRIILLEAMRVAAENGIETSDVAAFSAVIDKVKSNLGRKAA